MNFKNAALALMPIFAAGMLFSFAGSFDVAEAQTQCGQGEIQSGGTPEAGYVFCTPIEPEKPNTAPTVPSGPLWETRWGAIAVDDAFGKFGGADGLTSKRQAEKAAQNICKANGGTKCKTVIAYNDQCGVLAGGDTASTSSSGPDLQETTERAIANCNKMTNNCQAYYSGCSPPEQVQ
jgi:Domain of unknown function (DUF4189)